jgi:UDP-glucose 4-epimerase
VKVFVTGIAGFIGSNLADRLIADGHEVRGIDDLSSGAEMQVPAAADFVVGDILTANLASKMRGANAVVHLAAKNCISDCQTDPMATVRINVGGTAAVCSAMDEAAVPRLLYADSSARYEGTNVFPTPETASEPRSYYGIAKAAGADIAAAFGRHAGVAVTILRYFCVFGPRQDWRRSVPPVMPAFALALLRGERPVIYGDGSKRRDFVHVDDLNDFHAIALGNLRTAGRVVNLGSGVSHSVLEVLDAVSAAVGLTREPEFAPDLPGEAARTEADIRVALSFGWSPAWSFTDGVSSCVDHLRASMGSTG